MSPDLDPAGCRAVAVWCLTQAHHERRDGDLETAAAYDGNALGFTFRADELEYDARGGMTLRQAAERRAYPTRETLSDAFTLRMMREALLGALASRLEPPP